MKYSSVIFDMDGVILNSLVKNEQWKYQAVRRALEKKDVNVREVSKKDLERFLGDYGRKQCISVCAEYGLDAAEMWKLIAETTNIARIEKIKNGDFRLYSDARSLLEALHVRDSGMAVISNAPEDAVKTTVQSFNISKYFEYYRGVESFEDLRERKPHPDHLKIAEAELKREPFLYIGDSVSDVKAAKNADMDCAWVRRKPVEQKVEADYIVEDLKELGDSLELF